MSDFEVTGADQFLKLSKALKHAGRTGMRNDLNKQIRKAVKPFLPKAQQRLAAALPTPRKGNDGLSNRGGKVKQNVALRTGKDPGVSVTVSYGARGKGLHGSNAQLLNKRGRLRRPTGTDREDRSAWVYQDFPAAQGWFDETYEGAAPAIRPGVEQALKDVAERIVREGS